MLIFLSQYRTYVSLFESVICLVPGMLWNFLEARTQINYLRYAHMHDVWWEKMELSNPSLTECLRKIGSAGMTLTVGIGFR